MLQIASVGALLLVVAAAAALWLGGQALLDTRDMAAAYWFATGAVSVRAALVLTERRRA
jgi:hypothetical protein